MYIQRKFTPIPENGVKQTSGVNFPPQNQNLQQVRAHEHHPPHDIRARFGENEFVGLGVILIRVRQNRAVVLEKAQIVGLLCGDLTERVGFVV